MSTEASPTPDAAMLPDDAALLKQLVVQLLATLRTREARIEKLEQHMDWLVRRLFGRSSEKLDPRQLALFETSILDEAEQPAPAPPTPDTSTSTTKKKGHGRRPKPDTLERREVVHDLSDAEKAALGGPESLVFLGDEITEQYEWEPSCLYIIRHVQKKYARRPQLAESGSSRAEKNVITAPKPPAPIPGGIAGPGLLACVVVSRYADHLPFHRQEAISARWGQFFSRQTTDGWALACAELFQPLYNQMRREVLTSHVMGTDDTPVKVRDAHQKRRYTGRFWTYVGDERHPLTLFDFTSDRSRDGPEKFLAGYRGYLQADAYGAYDELYQSGDIVEVGCWAHARRKFFDNQKLDSARALTALAYIRQLYAVESDLRKRCQTEWRELTPEERAARVAAERQERSLPVLDQFHSWLEAELPRLLPQHPLREAMQYALNHWAALRRYTEDGQLSIDNNAAERALRGIAIGRKNWLFCGSDRGGCAAAIHFSLLASAHRHELNPFEYLRHLLQHLPTLGPAPFAEQLQPLLPHLCRLD